MKIAVFIDYDNLLDHHKQCGILYVVTRALLQTPHISADTRGTCDIRIYGGWFEGSTMTPLAQNITIELGSAFPAIIRIPNLGATTTALSSVSELAVSMLEEPSHMLFHTYRKKAKLGNIRVQDPSSAGCLDTECILPIAKKLLRTGACPKAACTVSSDDLAYRHEQKIVDTMLTCDLIFASTQGYSQIILISGDDDFLPPVRAMSLRGVRVVRFCPKPSSRRVPFSTRGTPIVDLDL